VLAINKSLLDIVPRTVGPAWVSRAISFKSTVSKICPRCGTFLPLAAKGCESCLFQFDIGDKKNVKRYGKRNIETE
jgi:ribosomal protein L40E